MPGDLDALIAELETADHGSRELSDEVLLALGWEHGSWGYWNPPLPSKPLNLYEASPRPSPTESVDDAIAECERRGAQEVAEGLVV